MKVNSNPWDTQNANTKSQVEKLWQLYNLEIFEFSIVGPFSLQSYSVRARFLHKKDNFPVKINKNMTRERHYFVKRQKADETSECFNNIKDWVRWHVRVTIYVIIFLRMHTELTLLLKHSPYISTIFWPVSWVSTWSVKWYIRIKKLKCLEKLFCSPQLHLGRILKNACFKN